VYLALGIQHAMPMRHIICGLPSFTVSFHISLKKRDFRKEVIQHKMRVFIFSTPLSETCFILRTERDMIKNIYLTPCIALSMLVRMYGT
jgi:hypothetical protein